MNQGPPWDERQRRLLQEAAEWRLLGKLFECPVGEWRRQVCELTREVTADTLRAAAQSAVEEAGEGPYHSVFGPGGPAPAREAACTPWLDLGQLLSELTACYEAFGYRPATVEPPDHVSVEAGFIGYLRLKETYALACSDEDRAAVAAEAASRFLEEHLGRLAEALAGQLAALGPSYLRRAAEELRRRIARGTGVSKQGD